MSIEVSAKVQAMQQTLEMHREHKKIDVYTRYAHAELVAHQAAYYVQGQSVIKLLDVDGEVREYFVQRIHTQNTGIAAYVLYGYGDNTNVHVVFRGTDFFDAGSVIRDLEHGGAGHESINAERDTIMSQVLDAVSARAAATKKKVNLSVQGHSLGGADAQNFFGILLDDMASAYKRNSASTNANRKIRNKIVQNSHLFDISRVAVYHVNSAGTRNVSASRCIQNAAYLAKRGIKFEEHALKVAGDAVQLSSQTSILAGAPASVAKVSVLRVEKASIIGSNKDSESSLGTYVDIGAVAALTYFGFNPMISGILSKAVRKAVRAAQVTITAHTSFHFDSGKFTDAEYKYGDNSTPEGALWVRRELSDKHWVDNNFVSHGFKRGLFYSLGAMRAGALTVMGKPRRNLIPENIQAGSFAYSSEKNTAVDRSFHSHQEYVLQALERPIPYIATVPCPNEVVYRVRESNIEMTSVVETAVTDGTGLYKATIKDVNVERGFLICLLNAEESAQRFNGGTFEVTGITASNARAFQRAYHEFVRQQNGVGHAVTIEFGDAALHALRAAGIYSLGPSIPSKSLSI